MASRVDTSGNSPATRKAEPVDATLQAKMAARDDELEAVRRELAVTRLERDDYRQEMFESNRYAAWLTHRSRDMTNVAPEPLQVDGPNLFADSANITDYVRYLEGKLWEAETGRLDTMHYVRYLEALCWDLETRRLTASEASASHRR